jgi:thiamine biosynthesis lipoprotein
MKKAVFVIISCLILLITGCGQKMQKRTRFMMDTVVTIQAPGGQEVLKAIDKAMDRMDEVDKKFAMLDKDSVIYKFNNFGTPITDPEILKIVSRALKVSELSGGKFDITIFPIVKLWGFYGTMHVPSKQEIKLALKDVGYRNLVLRDGKLTKLRKGTAIDIGGIAKLYCIEECANTLKREGVKNALIDGGGDIYAIGSDSGRPWKVGIKDPRGEGVIAAVDVTDMLVISSGDYERFFEKDGIRYHHLMDPFTGYPSRGLISSTIMCPDPAEADGLSSSVFLLGKDKGFAMLKKLGNVEALVVDEKQDVYYTEGLKDVKIVKVNKPVIPRAE